MQYINKLVTLHKNNNLLVYAFQVVRHGLVPNGAKRAGRGCDVGTGSGAVNRGQGAEQPGKAHTPGPGKPRRRRAGAQGLDHRAAPIAGI